MDKETIAYITEHILQHFDATSGKIIKMIETLYGEGIPDRIEQLSIEEKNDRLVRCVLGYLVEDNIELLKGGEKFLLKKINSSMKETLVSIIKHHHLYKVRFNYDYKTEIFNIIAYTKAEAEEIIREKLMEFLKSEDQEHYTFNALDNKQRKMIHDVVHLNSNADFTSTSIVVEGIPPEKKNMLVSYVGRWRNED